MLVIVFIDFLFSAIIAVNGSAKVGVDTHKWFNPQIQFNPGMLHQKLIHPYFLLTAFILDGSYLQTKLMTDIDHRVIYRFSASNYCSFDLKNPETNRNLQSLLSGQLSN